MTGMLSSGLGSEPRYLQQLLVGVEQYSMQ